MSSQGNKKTPSSPNSTKEKIIDDSDSFVADMASLCMDEPYSDVEFLVEDQRLPGHRLVLATRSEYFRALLYGGLAESNQREVPLEVPLEAFKVILGYLYSGRIPVSTLDVDTIIDVVDLAHLYGLQDVEAGIGKYLQQNLDISNVCTILNFAHRKNLNQRAEECFKFMDCNGPDILQHVSFEKLSKEALEEVLRRDSFWAPEIDIFGAVCKWRDNNPSEDFKTVAALVRLPLMTVRQLVQEVRRSGIYELDQILDVIDQADTGEDLPYRVALLPGVNVASGKHLARHFRDDQNREVYELRNPFVINYISFNGSCNAFGSPIYVDVSCDQTNWDRVEYLNFKERPVRYVRMHTSNVFINSLTAMYTEDPKK